MAKLGSYSYPDIRFGDAVELAARILTKFKGTVSVKGLAWELGMAEGSGTLFAKVAALRDFGSDARSAMAAPLKRDGRVIGTLAVYDKVASDRFYVGHFGDEDLQLFGKFVSYLERAVAEAGSASTPSFTSTPASVLAQAPEAVIVATGGAVASSRVAVTSMGARM